MRLHALDAARASHGADALRDLYFVRRNINTAGSPETERLTVLWLLSFGIEVDPQLGNIGNVFPAVGVMNIPGDTRTRQHQLPGVWPHEFTLFANGPFHKRSATRCCRCCRSSAIGIANFGWSQRLILL